MKSSRFENRSEQSEPVILSERTDVRGVVAGGTARQPVYFFAFSLLCFAYGSILLPALAPRAIRLFYQPGVLSLVHVFTLGFITSAIMGMMYAYVPALTHRSLAYPKLPLFQFAVYAIGVLGMISHFALGDWAGLWWAATVVVASVILFAINMLPLLWTAFGRGVAETGAFAATCCLLIAASLGLLMGLEESRGFVFGDAVTTLGSHVIFAAIGWMTLTICSLSYRFIPAFALPNKRLPAIALWQIVILAVSTAGLGISLLFNLPALPVWAIASSASLAAYVLMVAMLMASHRKFIDCSLSHSLAGIFWLVVAIALGQAVMYWGGWTPRGAPFAGALAAAALLGWAGNFIIDMSYRLLPGFVTRARKEARLPALSITELSVSHPRPFIFLGFNGGVIGIVLGFALRTPMLGAAGGWLIVGPVVLYAATGCWTLSFAYRK